MKQEKKQSQLLAQALQAQLEQKRKANPFDPAKFGAELTDHEAWDLVNQVKEFTEKDPEKAKALLSSNALFTQGLLHACHRLGMLQTVPPL